MRKLFLLSRYKEDFNWIKEYTDDYIIYNKGTLINNDSHVFNTENVGCNQRDIFDYVSTNYNNLPDIMIFIQCYPWDHCKKEVFDKLINNTEFTSLEYYGSVPANDWEGRTSDAQFLEINNSWYISQENNKRNQTCKYSSFDEFMNCYFENYEHLEWVRFAPGSQYLVPKENFLKYPKKFWGCLMNELNTKNPTEGYIIERALWYILSNTYSLRKEFYG
jgi:hypothetical protein